MIRTHRSQLLGSGSAQLSDAHEGFDERPRGQRGLLGSVKKEKRAVRLVWERLAEARKKRQLQMDASFMKT